MAKIIKKTAPKPKAEKKIPIWPLLAFLCAIFAGYSYINDNESYMLIGLCAVCFCVICSGLSWLSNTSDRMQIERAGEIGETATAYLISQLPEGYFGFQNLNVSYQGKSSEIDMVVVGRTGVFIIETKNLNGNIQGEFDSHQWIQYKIGRRGGQYSKNFYSPVKQVGTHTYRLAHFLRDRGCNVHVDAMVFFTNPNASVQVYGTPGKIPVYAGQTGAELIFKQILSGNANLTQNQINQICNLLNSYC